MSRSHNSMSGMPNYPLCAKCSRTYPDEFLAKQKGCFGCGKLGHRIRECSYAKQGNRDVLPLTQANSAPVSLGHSALPQGASSGIAGSQCQNHFYALSSRQEQENSPDIVTGMLCVFNFDVYVLLDPESSFSYVTPLVAVNFEINSEKIPEPFLVSTPVGDSFIAKKIYKKCPITFLYKVMLAELIELDMVDFDLILGLDWLHS